MRYCIFSKGAIIDFQRVLLPDVNICRQSHFGYDCEDRPPCKCETSQKSPDFLFDSVLIIQFVTLEINRSQPETTIALNSSPRLPLLSVPHARIQKGAVGLGSPPEKSQKDRVS